MITRCAPVLISTVTAIPGDSVISSEPARVTYEDKDTLVIEPGARLIFEKTTRS